MHNYYQESVPMTKSSSAISMVSWNLAAEASCERQIIDRNERIQLGV
jgi:hypothetical protein